MATGARPLRIPKSQSSQNLPSWEMALGYVAATTLDDTNPAPPDMKYVTIIPGFFVHTFMHRI